MLDGPKGISNVMNSDRYGNRSVPVEGIPDNIANLPGDQFNHIVNVLKSSAHLGNGELAEGAAAALNEIKGHMAARMHEAGASARSGIWDPYGFHKVADKYSNKMPAVFSQDEINRWHTVNRGGNILRMDARYPGASAQAQVHAGLGLRERAGNLTEGLIADAIPFGGTVGEATGISPKIREVLGGSPGKRHLKEVEGRIQKLPEGPPGTNSATSPQVVPLGMKMGGKQGGWIGNKPEASDFDKAHGVTMEGDTVTHKSAQRDVTHHVNEDGDHVFQSGPSSITGHNTPDGGIQIHGSATPGAQSEGYGTSVYRAAADHALGNGGPLHSDAVVSGDATRRWNGLKNEGYTRTDNPTNKETASGGVISDNGQPAFTITGKGEPQRTTPLGQRLGGGNQRGGPKFTGKMDPEDFKHLRDNVNVPADSTRRERWDALWMAQDSGKLKRPGDLANEDFTNSLHKKGLNDDHIDTALKAVGKSAIPEGGARPAPYNHVPIVSNTGDNRPIGQRTRDVSPLGQRLLGGNQRGGPKFTPKAEAAPAALKVSKPQDDISTSAESAFGSGNFDVRPGVHTLPFSDVELQGTKPYNMMTPLDRTPEFKARVDKLTTQIERTGRITPLMVGKRADGSMYVMEGQHRARALQTLGHKTFPAQIADERVPNAEPATLNVGLHQGTEGQPGFRKMSKQEATKAIEATGAKVTKSTVTPPEGGEPTLVASTNRALTGPEMQSTLAKTKQSAIPQRTANGEGEMHIAPGHEATAAEQGWDKYNPDYFREHDGRTATEHATDFNPTELEAQNFEPHPSQTVTGPQRNAYPGIYDKPKDILSRLKVAPEDPILKQLFGVTRADLSKTALGREGNLPGDLPGGAAKPKGSAAATKVMTKENEDRLVALLNEAKKNPALHDGMTGWYVMDPLHTKFQQVLGAKAGTAAYSRLNHLMGMASPGSDVVSEIKRGTAANMMASQGKFEQFLKHAGTAETDRRVGFPPELEGVPGHPYHRTAQGGPMAKYLESGQMTMKTPKVPMYIQSSGVPATGFQTRTAVGDSHWSRGVGLSDVRNPTVHGPSSSVTNPEMSALKDWYREKVAKRAGLPAVSAQALQWGALGGETGVGTAVGAPKLELFAQQVKAAADRVGVTPKEMLKLIIKGTHRAG